MKGIAFCRPGEAVPDDFPLWLERFELGTILWNTHHGDEAVYVVDGAVEIEGHPIRVKVGLLGDRVVNVAPEHDDCAAAAAATGRPVKHIWARALAAAQELDAVAR